MLEELLRSGFESLGLSLEAMWSATGSIMNIWKR